MSANTMTLFGVARPNFLLLPPVCIALAVGVVVYEGGAIDAWRLSLVVIGALASHIAVNALNEHADFLSGLDFHTERTPFSGGSGTLVAHPELAPAARWLGLGATLVAAVSGLLLLVLAGWGLLPFGLVGLALVLAYSGPLGRQRWLVLVAPGLGFGPVMVLGSVYALGGGMTPLAVAASLLVFFLVNNLLLLNQFPDREADRRVGRDNIVIADLQLAARVYGLFLMGAMLSAIWTAWCEPWSLLALVPLLLAIRAWQLAQRFDQDNVAALLPAMAVNVAVTLMAPALLAGVLFARYWLET